MQIIPIDGNYRLAGTPRAWELQKRRRRKDRKTKQPIEAWEPCRWYASLESALHGVAQLRLRVSDARSIGEAQAEVLDLLAGLGQALAAPVDASSKATAEAIEAKGRP